MHWQDTPYRIQVKSGDKKSICRCGKTQNPPFCDGAHKGTGIEPDRITFNEDQTVAICGCGKSQKMPYCDGSHRKATQ